METKSNAESKQILLQKKIIQKMKNLFNSIQLKRPNRNVFDLTHDVKLSFNMGELIPVMCMETVPGDKLHLNGEAMVRFMPLVAPPMHRYDLYIHYFFVPNRILWDKWEDFITQKDVNGAIPAFPYLVMEDEVPRLSNYLGLPKAIGGEKKISMLAHAAYQAIYREYYRDQTLIDQPQDAIFDKLLDGNNEAIYNQLVTLRRRAWEHDYFTSCLPFAQAGAPVDIPLGDVKLKDDWEQYGTPSFKNTSDNVQPGDLMQQQSGIGLDGVAGSIPQAYDPNDTLEVEATKINDLRRAFKLQEWLEKNARAGRRYIESIFAHFGVKSSDARLQRPEYITGIKSPISISEVLNTTGTADAPQGNMAGHGIGYANGHSGKFFCEEHGYVIGIMSVMPKTAYQQGIPRHFLKYNDPFQYYWPEFAHIGEQEVYHQEIYAQSLTPDGTFGYNPRYSEYKFMNNRVCGDMADSLDFWHSGRIFANPPQLNKQFIECVTDDRIFAVTDPNAQKLIAQVVNKIMATRPMPKFGTPTF